MRTVPGFKPEDLVEENIETLKNHSRDGTNSVQQEREHKRN